MLNQYWLEKLMVRGIDSCRINLLGGNESPARRRHHIINFYDQPRVDSPPFLGSLIIINTMSILNYLMTKWFVSRMRNEDDLRVTRLVSVISHLCTEVCPFKSFGVYIVNWKYSKLTKQSPCRYFSWDLQIFGYYLPLSWLFWGEGAAAATISTDYQFSSTSEGAFEIKKAITTTKYLDNRTLLMTISVLTHWQSKCLKVEALGCYKTIVIVSKRRGPWLLWHYYYFLDSSRNFPLHQECLWFISWDCWYTRCQPCGITLLDKLNL